MGTLYILRAEVLAEITEKTEELPRHGPVRVLPDQSLLLNGTSLPAGVPTSAPWSPFGLIWCPCEPQLAVEETRTLTTELLPVPDLRLDIIVSGGSDLLGHNRPEVWAFQPAFEDWRELAPMQTGRSGHAAVAIAHELRVCGGAGAFGAADELYNVQTGEWQWTGRHRTRRDFAATGSNWGLFTAGGHGAWVPTARVEVAGAEQPNMLEARCGHQLARVDSHVFALGGLGGSGVYDDRVYGDRVYGDSFVLSSVERFSAREKRWDRVAPMTKPRMYFGCAVVARDIYVFGGQRALAQGATVAPALADCARYNVDADLWTDLCPMPCPLYRMAVAAAQNEIFVFGGRQPDGVRSDKVYKYHIIEDSWEFVGRMPRRLESLAATTVTRPQWRKG